jgi:hypothetical protein
VVAYRTLTRYLAVDVLVEKSALFGPDLLLQPTGAQFGGEVTDYENELFFLTFHGVSLLSVLELCGKVTFVNAIVCMTSRRLSLSHPCIRIDSLYTLFRIPTLVRPHGASIPSTGCSAHDASAGSV